MTTRSHGRAVTGKVFDGDLFGELLVDNGFTLSSFSRATAEADPEGKGIPPNHLSWYRSGTHTPRPPRLAIMAAVFQAAGTQIKPTALLKPA